MERPQSPADLFGFSLLSQPASSTSSKVSVEPSTGPTAAQVLAGRITLQASLGAKVGGAEPMPAQPL